MREAAVPERAQPHLIAAAVVLPRPWTVLTGWLSCVLGESSEGLGEGLAGAPTVVHVVEGSPARNGVGVEPVLHARSLPTFHAVLH